MAVKLLDLVEQNNQLRQNLITKFDEILKTGMFILGPEVENFENHCAEYLSSKHVLGVSSGTDALLLALMALDIKAGDEVLCPAYTFFATAGCISRVGAIPIFVDVNFDDFCISIDDLKGKISKQTKAIIGVHLFGQACNCTQIVEVCKNNNIKFIEDCAQSFGAQRNGKQTGTFGDIGCFSFFPSKNLGGFGDSGLVCSNDEILYENMQILRIHGMSPKYFHKKIGGNFRIDALQAALLDIKLNYIDEYIAKRRQNANFYHSHLSNLNGKFIELPQESKGNFHTWNQFTIRVLNGKRNELKNYLQKHQIGCEIYYPVPLNRQECFIRYENSCSVAEKLSLEALSLPIYPELSEYQLLEVIKTLQNFFN